MIHRVLRVRDHEALRRCVDSGRRLGVAPFFLRLPASDGVFSGPFEVAGAERFRLELILNGFREVDPSIDWGRFSEVFLDTEALVCDQRLLGNMRDRAREAGIPFTEVCSNRLYFRLPIEGERELRTFTDFRKALKREPDSPVGAPPGWSTSGSIMGPEELVNTADPRSMFPFSAGEDSARERVESYIRDPALLSRYKDTRNGLLSVDDSSKLSPFLARGMVSARSVWSEIRKAESLNGVSEGSEWLRFELLWREYFRWLEKRHRDSFYSERGIRNVAPQSSSEDPEKFAAWREGRTGQRFVDANMRELKQTGFMSNRGRQNVASYFIHELGLPWLWGAGYFERMLVDADPVQNTGNWAYLAGVGADPRSFGGGARRFNVEEQADRYDPEGRYRSLWVD